MAYEELAARYGAPRLKPPFNLAARQAAGFSAAEIAAAERKLWTFNNYFSGADLSKAIRVVTRPDDARFFSEGQTYVDENWVPVTKDQSSPDKRRYFKGIQLYRKGRTAGEERNRLAVRLYVTDENFNLDERVENTDWSNVNSGVHLHHAKDDWYFDTTPQRIPHGKLITAVRLAQPNPRFNRIGLQIKVANPDGTGEETLVNEENNQGKGYIDRPSRGVRPSYQSAVLPGKANVVSICLTDLSTDKTVVGIEILTMPVPTT